MKTVPKSLIAVAAAVSLLGSLSACGSGSPASKTVEHVKLAWVPGSTELPILVAQHKGYFAAEGLEVELVKVNSGAEAIPLVATGRLDAVMASASAAMFNALGSGLKFKAVASDNVNPAPTADGVCPSPLMVRKSLVDSGEVKSVKDLAGRKIAVAGGLGTGGAFYVEKMLSAGGASIKDTKVVQLAGSDAEAGLRSGAIDAAASYEPFASAMVNAGVAVRYACPPTGIGITHLLYGETLTSRADAASGLHAALARASEDLQGEEKRSEATLKAVATATGQDLEAVRKLPQYDYKTNLPPLTDVLQEMQTFFREVGTLNYENNLPTSEFVDSSYYEGRAKK